MTLTLKNFKRNKRHKIEIVYSGINKKIKIMFKVGDKVRVIGNRCGSINQVGDEGIITEIEESGLAKSYKVSVEGRANIINWHGENELEIIK